MNGRFIRVLTAGAVIGAAAGMMMVPQMNRRTRKMIRRNSKMMMNRAGDIFDNVKDWMM
ncbi:YtxH domain-containing protein [Clostridium sp. JNZ J1-5]|nr:YtxH domain-containing protein [Clostridium sp.]